MQEHTKQELINYYTQDNLSFKQISKIMNISPGTVGYHLKKNKIPIRKSGGRVTYDPQEAIRLYEQGLTLNEVAERLNVNKTSIHEQFKKYKINITASADPNAIALYFKECGDLNKTALHFNLSQSYICTLLRKQDARFDLDIKLNDLLQLKEQINSIINEDPNITIKELYSKFKHKPYFKIVQLFKECGGVHDHPLQIQQYRTLLKLNHQKIVQWSRQGLGYNEMSRQLDVPVGMLKRYTDYNNIKKSDDNFKINVKYYEQLNNPKLLKDYLLQYDNITNINKQVFNNDISVDTIRFYYCKHNIPHKILLQDKIPTLQDKNELIKLYKTNSIISIAALLGVSSPTISKAFNELDIPRDDTVGRSKLELKLLEDIKSFYNGTIIENDRIIITPKELDIVFPDEKLAIEVCGIYWHSEQFKSNNYHRDKMLSTEAQGYRLLTIFEDELTFNYDLVLKKLQTILRVRTKSVYARKTTAVTIQPNETREFLNKNHIQGYTGSSICYGLKLNEELVAVMTFKKFKEHFELSRFATSSHVVGGFSKLLTHFKRNNDWNRITTFADLRWSSRFNNVYELNDFNEVHVTKPAYFYYDFSSKKLIHRMNFQRKFLKQKLKTYDENLSERKNANLNNYYAVYNCGNVKYEMNRKEKGCF